MTESGPTQATFCYQCGRRVNKQSDTCWYCGVPTRRWIRRPKRCPFCGEDVRHEAIKCRHCGEFIDGRPREAAPPAQVVFVVDRQLLQGMHEARLLAGRPVPPEVARVLDAQTVRAIETGQPRLLTQPGVRALPAPDAAGSDEGVIDVQPVSRGRALPAPDQSSTLPATQPQLPARRGESLPERPGAGGGGLGKALIKAGGWLVRKALAGPPPKPADDAIDARAADRFRVCERCQAEILVDDNFCYACGMQYHKAAVEHQELVLELSFRRRRRLHTTQFLVTIVLVALHAVLKMKLVSIPYEAIAQPAAAGVALGLSVLGIFRRGWVNKFLSLALGAIAAAALVLWK